MKKHILIGLSLIVIASFLLVGCGSENAFAGQASRSERDVCRGDQACINFARDCFQANNCNSLSRAAKKECKDACFDDALALSSAQQASGSSDLGINLNMECETINAYTWSDNFRLVQSGQTYLNIQNGNTFCTDNGYDACTSFIRTDVGSNFESTDGSCQQFQIGNRNIINIPCQGGTSINNLATEDQCHTTTSFAEPRRGDSRSHVESIGITCCKLSS